MPAKNSVKEFVEGGFYHLYNRGVEKRNIFLDEHDYKMFIHLLKYYLDSKLGSDPKHKIRNLSSEIDLLAYCLMPNHFHLLVRQKSSDGITKLMRRVCTNYVMYFNNRYDRVGTLFQGKYKAALVTNEGYLLHLSRYIHLNPKDLEGIDYLSYPYSSFANYLDKRNTAWLKPKEILDFFKKDTKTRSLDFLSYQSFAEDYKEDSKDLLDLTLD